MFLFERVFADVLDRLSVVNRRFSAALLVGCPDANWPARLGAVADTVSIVEPGPLFATLAGGTWEREDHLAAAEARYDLCVAVGTLDTANDLPAALIAVRRSLRPESLLIGALPGGDTLPRLRAAMRAADDVAGGAVPHIHPRIEARALGPLLSSAGFRDPVVDVDRVDVAYPSMNRLIADLRRMGATNILTDRSRRSLTRAAWAAATQRFEQAAPGERVTERFELLHFAAWTPREANQG